MSLHIRRASLAATMFAAATFGTATTAFAQAPTTYQVRTRDGVNLATDVFLPTGPAGTRYPTVLRRTPYDRTTSPELGRNFASLGYVFVAQDVRGRHASQGRFLPFFDDAHDGPDTMAWIAAQPWSNGRIGTYGASAEGIVQLMALPDAPAGLRCAYSVVATDDVYEGMLPGGAWRAELTTNWLTALGAPMAYADLRAHEAADAYWDPARVDPTERSRVHNSTMLVGGFFDIFSLGTPRTHRLLREQATAAVRGDQFLVFGPWTHGGIGSATQGEVTFDSTATYPAAITDLVALYDWCLKDGPRPSFPPVRYYVTRFGDSGTTGTGDWRTAETWPPPASPVTMYLHDSHVLRGETPSPTGMNAALPVNPMSPVPSNGGGNLTTLAGPRDQAAIDARADVVVAQTAVVTNTVEIIGDLHASIWASSATDDVDVVVRVSDITPSGKVLLITDGVRRGRFVAGYDRIRPLVAGTPMLFDVPVGPISIALAPGHALRVAISGSSSPRYEANPNTAVSLATNPAPRMTTLTVFRDATHPSAVVLPIARGVLPGSVPTMTDAGVDAASPDAATVDAAGADAVVIADANPDSGPNATDTAARDANTADGGTRMSAGCACTTRPVQRTVSGLAMAAIAACISGLRSRTRRRSKANA